ncbi:hypothetical protein SAMN06265349_1035 [Flavobacterium resistens]|uniref:Uncharacterized protein n=1 Tax=Flavobacterium resistens TaxID=443612 RepID=A0A521D8E5_9FLAO|nr:hypothetical protein [Flavobacterium resistens]MRX70387.1 hypothetical protein [Flavobacterium resistens]SMO67963.1 hypothetical protein SAMN06265349_1035 [Flavobacterium resistens]
MKKESVLVRDNKGSFLKMFKRSFKDEFDFFESPFLLQDENKSRDFDRSIFVVYDKFEMIEYLKLDIKVSSILVCLFNRQLYGSLSFLEEINSLILMDDTKTRIEIVKELKTHLKSKPGNKTQIIKKSLPNAPFLHTEFHNFYKALFFLM